MNKSKGQTEETVIVDLLLLHISKAVVMGVCEKRTARIVIRNSEIVYIARTWSLLFSPFLFFHTHLDSKLIR